KHRQHHSPRWCGQPLEGKRLLLIVEDDARETVLLIRYADVLAQQGARIAVVCQPELVPLLKGALGVTWVCSHDEVPSPHDFHLYLPSLPAVTGTRPDNIPANRPYLGVENTLLEHWTSKLARTRPLRVGISLGSIDVTRAGR